MTSSAKCTACNQRALLLASLPYLGVIFPFDRAVLREKKKKKKVFAWNAEGSGHCLLLAKVSILIFVEQRERYPCCHISEGGGEGKRGGVEGSFGFMNTSSIGSPCWIPQGSETVLPAFGPEESRPTY